MTKRKEHTKCYFEGKRYDKLVILSCIEPSKGSVNDNGLWECQCDCGNTIIRKGCDLRFNRATNCGCIRQAFYKEPRVNRRNYSSMTINAQYGVHKHKSKGKGLGYLEKGDWLKLVTQPCHYCGEIDKRNSATAPGYKNKGGQPLTKEEIALYEVSINGVDRVDSSKGYSVDNVVPCCGQCNTMKMAYQQEDFYKKVELIYNKRAYSNVTLEQYLCN